MPPMPLPFLIESVGRGCSGQEAEGGRWRNLINSASTLLCYKVLISSKFDQAECGGARHKSRPGLKVAFLALHCGTVA